MPNYEKYTAGAADAAKTGLRWGWQFAASHPRAVTIALIASLLGNLRWLW